MTRDLTLWNCMQQSVNDASPARNLTMTLLDAQENPVIVWAFHNAFLMKWACPPLNTQSNEIAIETLELVHEGFTMTSTLEFSLRIRRRFARLNLNSARIDRGLCLDKCPDAGQQSFVAVQNHQTVTTRSETDFEFALQNLH